MDKPQDVCEDKDDGLQCLCYQHIAVWQRDMDYAGQERRLNTFHLRSIRRILGISWQDKVTNVDVLSRASLLSVHLAQTTQTAMVGSYPKYGGWSHPKRHPLRSDGIGEENNRPPSPTIKICLPRRYEGCRHQQYVLGGPCS